MKIITGPAGRGNPKTCWLLQLLLGTELTRVATLLLAAVVGARMEPGIAPAETRTQYTQDRDNIVGRVTMTHGAKVIERENIKKLGEEREKMVGLWCKWS